MKLVSKKVTVARSQQEVFNFLSSLENYEQLMPENTEKFEVEGESFVFALKNMPEIRLLIKEKTEFDSIILGAASSKLNFTLRTAIVKSGDQSTELELLFEGDFNPMMAMMVKGPLQKFIDTLAENAEKL